MEQRAEASQEQERENARITLAFYELAFVKRQIREAYTKYVAKDYVQHNPTVPTGRDAAIATLIPFMDQHPYAEFNFKRVLADGDLVALHLHNRFAPNEPGLAVVDIFRLKDGLIVEHWDLVQPVAEAAENSNSMF